MDRDSTVRHVDLVVLGGGLAGLSAAYRFRQGGVDDLLVLERESRAGGLLKTNRTDAFEIDHLPHVFFTHNQPVRQIFEELVGPVYEYRHRLGVLWKGGYIDYPFQNHVHQLDIQDRRRVLVGLLERQTNQGCSPNNLEELAVQRLGRGLNEMFFKPYNEKLWQTPLAQMDCRWIEAKIRLPNVQELADSILGTVEAEPFDRAPHSTFVYPQSGGIETLVDGLAARVGMDRIECATTVHEIDPIRRHVSTSRGTIAYDRLISTLPLDCTLRMAGLSGSENAAMARLSPTRVVAVQYVLTAVNLPDYHWIYVPEGHVPFYRLTRVDRINPGAARGRPALLVEWAFASDQDYNLAQIIERTTHQLQSLGIATPDAVEHCCAFTYCPAYVVPHRTHVEDVASLLRTLTEVGIECAGRFGEWRFYNMDHTMESGFQAADRVLGTCSRS